MKQKTKEYTVCLMATDYKSERAFLKSCTIEEGYVFNYYKNLQIISNGYCGKNKFEYPSSDGIIYVIGVKNFELGSKFLIEFLFKIEYYPFAVVVDYDSDLLQSKSIPEFKELIKLIEEYEIETKAFKIFHYNFTKGEGNDVFEWLRGRINLDNENKEKHNTDFI